MVACEISVDLCWVTVVEQAPTHVLRVARERELLAPHVQLLGTRGGRA